MSDHTDACIVLTGKLDDGRYTGRIFQGQHKGDVTVTVAPAEDKPTEDRP